MEKLWEKILNLRFFEAIDISNLKRDGKGAKKIRFNPLNPRQGLALVPGWAQVVFQMSKGRDGVKNFLQLCCGYDSNQIKEILKRVVPFTSYILDESKLVEGDIYLFRVKKEDPGAEEVVGDILAQVIEKKGDGYRFLALKFPHSVLPYIRSNGTFTTRYLEEERGPKLLLGEYRLLLKDYIPVTIRSE